MATTPLPLPQGMSRKEHVDALLGLAEVSSRDLQDRRSYEWKISFALWTPLALIGWGYLQLPSSTGNSGIASRIAPVASWGHIVLVALLCVIAWLYTGIWMRGLHERNWRNGRTANYLLNEVETILGTKSARLDESQKPRYKNPEPMYKDWSHLPQLGFTWILLASDFVAIHIRAPEMKCFPFFVASAVIAIALALSIGAAVRGFPNS